MRWNVLKRQRNTHTHTTLKTCNKKSPFHFIYFISFQQPSYCNPIETSAFNHTHAAAIALLQFMQHCSSVAIISCHGSEIEKKSWFAESCMSLYGVACAKPVNLSDNCWTWFMRTQDTVRTQDKLSCFSAICGTALPQPSLRNAQGQTRQFIGQSQWRGGWIRKKKPQG